MNSWQVILYNTHPLLRDRPRSSSERLSVGCNSLLSVCGASDYINNSCLEKKLRRRHHRGRRRLRLVNGRTTILLNQLPAASPSRQRSFWQRYSNLRASKNHIRSRINRVTEVPTNQQTPATVLQPSSKPAKEAATAVRTRIPFYYIAAV